MPLPGNAATEADSPQHAGLLVLQNMMYLHQLQILEQLMGSLDATTGAGNNFRLVHA